MTQRPASKGTGRPPVGEVGRIEADIESGREHLAHTVDQLAARLDVPSRARARAFELLDQTTTGTGRPRPGVVTAAAAVAVAVVALAWWRR